MINALSALAVWGYAPALRANMANVFIPTEDEPHDGCFMQFPVHQAVYGDRYFLQSVQNRIISLANQIADFEPVFLAADQVFHSQIAPKLHQNVTLWDIPTDDLWARDSGPVFAFEGENPVILDFQFNGWGNKQPHKNDGKIAKRVAEYLGLSRHVMPFIGEAGGIEWDGAGLLLAHESSWVNPNRNALSKAELSKALISTYGASEILWAKGVYDEDITDYHIDSLARFVAPGHVVFQFPYGGAGEIWYDAAQESYEVIHAHDIKITEIYAPENPRITSEDFVDSYVNYYLANGAIIGAEFGDKSADEQAKATISALYPQRAYIGINVDELGELGGGIHCATQQIPKGVL